MLTTDPSGLGEADVVLDGILGIGARPGLPDWAVGWLAALSETAHVIAVDLPSGPGPDGWRARPRRRLRRRDGDLLGRQAGAPAAADRAGLRAADRRRHRPRGRRTTRSCAASTTTTSPRCWPVPVATDDKYSRGVLGVVAGGESYSGAAVLSVTAAVEAGCGMVRYVGTPTPTGLVRAGGARGGARRRPGAGLGRRAGARRHLAGRGREGPARRGTRGARRRGAGRRRRRWPRPARRRRARRPGRMPSPSSPRTRGSAPASSPGWARTR